MKSFSCSLLAGLILLCASSFNSFSQEEEYPEKPIHEFGFYRVAVASPKIYLGDPNRNTNEILEIFEEANLKGASVVLTPEMSVTGYTIEDLVQNSALLSLVKDNLVKIRSETVGNSAILIVGAPYQSPTTGRMYNVAFAFQNGELVAAVPKENPPAYGEFDGGRWFASGKGVHEVVEDPQLGRFLLSQNQIVKLGDLKLAIEICEDLWAPEPPSGRHARAGANVIVNPSASNEVIGKYEYRQKLVEMQSARTLTSYLYASANTGESSRDLVFGGHLMVYENGVGLLGHESLNDALDNENLLIGKRNVRYTDINVAKIEYERRRNMTFQNSEIPEGYKIHEIDLMKFADHPVNLIREINQSEFIPKDFVEASRNARLGFEIVKAGIERRIEKIAPKSIVLGISGGLDSTIALLFAHEVATKMRTKVVAVTMPSDGTTDQTYRNAKEMATILQADLREIPIADEVKRQMALIGHQEGANDTAFENITARTRTRILMDIAGLPDVQGFVLGTGDLSEVFQGWMTYNGDHMSHYGANASIPKSLIKFMVNWWAENRTVDSKLRRVLKEVVGQTITPELLRSDGVKIIQKTEDKIGPFILLEFYLHKLVSEGASPEQMLFLAKQAFKNEFDEATLEKWLRINLVRYVDSQFKRDTQPPGPKVGRVSFSPRRDHRLPPDIMCEAFLGMKGADVRQRGADGNGMGGV